MWVAGDNLKIKRTCKRASDSTVIDLTGATVKLYYSIDGGARQTKTMTITSAALGQVEYQFLTTDLISGKFVGEIEITDSSGKIYTCDPKIERNIQDRLPAAA